MADKKKNKVESNVRIIAWTAYILMGVAAVVIALQDPVILRAFYAEDDAHRAAMDECSKNAREAIHERMLEGEFTLYGSFIRTPGAQLKCLNVSQP